MEMKSVRKVAVFAIHLAIHLAMIGACVMLGVRAIEWLIPRPETKVLVCLYEDLGELECRPVVPDGDTTEDGAK